MSKKTENTFTWQQIDDTINKAVQIAFDAGYAKATQQPKEVYQATERRLRRYPILILNIERYNDTIADLKREAALYAEGTRNSKDIARMQASGVRLTKEEILKTRIMAIRKKKQTDENEIKAIEEALDIIKDDPYFRIIELKYFEPGDLTDDQISDDLGCDQSTTSRNRKRLINSVIDVLYGAKDT